MIPSDSIEATASTVEQAISQALDQLGAHHDDVTIEVLSTPRSGVLGLGARPARVRVTRRAPEIARSSVQSPPPAPPLKRTPPEISHPSEPLPAQQPETSGENRPASRGEASLGAVGATSPAPALSSPQPSAAQFESEDLREEPDAGARPNSSQNAPQSADSRNVPSRESATDDRPRRDSPGEGRRGRDFRGSRRRDDRSAPRSGRSRDQNRQNQDDRRPDSSRASAPDDSSEAPRQASPASPQETRSINRSDESPRPRRDRDRPPRAAGNERPADTGPRPRSERPRRDDSIAAQTGDSDLDSFSDDGSGNEPRNLVPPEEQVAEATAILTEVLKMMGEQAEIEIVRDEGIQTVELNIKGDGSGILIGRHGQTLDALEYIVNRILGRRIKDAVAIAIDTESYRARRRGQLHRMALSKGEQAKREHVTVTLDPMAPRDRRIVHLALRDDPLITTHSFGEGFLRSIEIVPVDGSQDRDRGNRGGRDRRQEPDRDRDNDDLPLGQQGGFKHGQKRIV